MIKDNLNPGLIDNVLMFIGVVFVCVCAVMVCIKYTNTRREIASAELKAMASIETKLEVIENIVDMEKVKRREIKNRVAELEQKIIFLERDIIESKTLIQEHEKMWRDNV